MKSRTNGNQKNTILGVKYILTDFSPCLKLVALTNTELEILRNN